MVPMLLMIVLLANSNEPLKRESMPMALLLSPAVALIVPELVIISLPPKDSMPLYIPHTPPTVIVPELVMVLLSPQALIPSPNQSPVVAVIVPVLVIIFL